MAPLVVRRDVKTARRWLDGTIPGGDSTGAAPEVGDGKRRSTSGTLAKGDADGDGDAADGIGDDPEGDQAGGVFRACGGCPIGVANDD
jgi:hypothetical protein